MKQIPILNPVIIISRVNLLGAEWGSVGMTHSVPSRSGGPYSGAPGAVLC